MTFTNAMINNLVSGELDPLISQREDLKVNKSGAEFIENWFALEQGPIRKRPGFRFIHTTRRNKKATLIPFQFNDSDAYLIEATDGYFRFYRNEGVIVEDAVAVSGATKANPCVITTSSSHGYSTGDEIFINDVVGMTQLNGKAYVITVLSATTFSLQDNYGNNINSTAYTTYSSGGAATKIYEVQTPYEEDYLGELQYAQNADTMDITHRRYEQRQLTRTGNTNWSLARYSRTSDPYGSAQAISGITQANPAVLTYSGADTFENGDQVFIDEVAGMAEVNNTHFLVANINKGANTFELQDLSGTDIDSTGYGAYSSAGKVEKINNVKHPRSVFYTDDARKGFGGPIEAPDVFRLSRGPDGTGSPRYNDFTVGTAADHSVVFTLSPVQGQADVIQWMSNNDKFIVIGTFSTIRRVYGATEAEPLTPTSVTAKFVDSVAAALALPVPKGGTIFYIPQGKKSVNSFEYDFVIDGYVTTDRTLVAGHLFDSAIRAITFQEASPNILWGVREDGRLLGLTFKSKEDISGWHRHKIGDGAAKDAKVLSVGVMPRTDNKEQFWIVSERTINGNVVRAVEYMEDFVSFPVPAEFYSGQNNKVSDGILYRDYSYELAKEEFFVDMGVTYDGRSVGASASASVTPSATTGSITITASASVFTSAMVGREVWKPYTATGGGGRAVITAYNSGTSVGATVITDFDSTASMAAGSWYLTTASVSGLSHLEGEAVSICVDGAEHPTRTVTNGAITLDDQYSFIHVGLKYTAIWKSRRQNQGGINGTGMNKPKNIQEVHVTFAESTPPLIGTDLYNLERMTFREIGDLTDRPPPRKNGTVRKRIRDSYSDQKHIYIVHDTPLPCIILSVDPDMETVNE